MMTRNIRQRLLVVNLHDVLGLYNRLKVREVDRGAISKILRNLVADLGIQRHILNGCVMLE